MGLAISQLTTQFVQDAKFDIEYQLTLITDQLQVMAMRTESVVTEQMRAGQVYMDNHKDEEGEVDISAIEYVNSSAFNAKYQAKLSQIQVKERQLTVQKTQLETRQKLYSTQQESWEKSIDNGIKRAFQRG